MTRCYVLILLCVIGIYSCNRGNNNSASKQHNSDTISTANSLPKQDIGSIADTSIVLTEHFVDSTVIGRPSHNKIEIDLFHGADTSYVTIKFYSKIIGGWHLQQEMSFDKDAVTGCNTILSDYNNDGFKDITYQSMIAARSANEVRKLFIYDKRSDKLVYIRNSEDYPNLQYNTELNCIDGWMVYGGTATVFGRIYKDSLIEFASVELDDGYRTVTVTDKYGRRTVLSKDSITDEGYFERFSNYKPLKTATGK